MPETIIESVLTGKLDKDLLIKWLNGENIEDTLEDCVLFCCERNEFVAYFLSYLRNQADSVLQTNSSSLQILQHTTPDKFLSSYRNHKRSVSDPTSEDRSKNSLTVKNDRHSTHESPNKERKRGRKVKTKLFNEDSNQTASSEESRLSFGVDKIIISSTPLKNGHYTQNTESPSTLSPVTPNWSYNERCDTPRLSHRHSRSHEKSCLGDYMVNIKSSNRKKKPIKSDGDVVTLELDISNSEMFPEIGAKKSSFAREKRRIKPTNIDKSQSLTSFTAECFQQPPPLALQDNAVFRQEKMQMNASSNSFEVERNLLKQERHKLMEKFNILNTSQSQKQAPVPQIKVTQRETVEITHTYTKANIHKVMFKEKIDILTEIYAILLKNNLILSINSEIYFLISILVSKQSDANCMSVECRLRDNKMDALLRTIHNCTYFAVKSLWSLRAMLEIVLDKNSLKILGENKKVRSFYPELAKFLLNCYGLRCEAESTQERPKVQENRSASEVVCFNVDTDNAENYPSMQSFQNFKKQRDMFYEILRWYQEGGALGPAGVARSALRGRIKALVCAGAAPANHKRLAALFLHHLQHQAHHAQESKISKLQRRLVFPNAPESHRLPHFSEKEIFYKEFIINAENENFRVHLRDALSSEIVALDSTHVSLEDRGNSQDISKEYLALAKKSSLLGKFLGYMTSLPYCQASELLTKSGAPVREHRELRYEVPKEKVLENDLALRSYSQPNIDLKGILKNAEENERLAISVPWIVHYLSMLDYTTLRTRYYHELIKNLFGIYLNRLKVTPESKLKRNTAVYLISVLGWLFDMPHFPRDIHLYENYSVKMIESNDTSIDHCDLIDETAIFELCPYLREVNVLLSTCKVSQEQKESTYRHITPVSLSLNPEDRIRSKEREMQNRLEEELLKSQPSSTRRVLELVIERVTSASVKELTATTLLDAQQQARDLARKLVLAKSSEDTGAVARALQTHYRSQLQALRARALESGGALASARVRGALGSLLPAASAALHSLAAKAARNRLAKWLANNWNTTAILCKDIETEMKTFLALGDLVSVSQRKPSVVDLEAMLAPEAQFEANNVSPADCLIKLKELACLLLDGEDLGDLGDVGELLAQCAASCSPGNVFSRAATQRTMLQLSLDFCLIYVSRRPADVTDQFLDRLYCIWNTCCPDRQPPPPLEVSLPERREGLSPEFRSFVEDERSQTPQSDDEPVDRIKIVINGPEIADEVPVAGQASSAETSDLSLQDSKMESNPTPDENAEWLEFFDRVLCPRNIVLLSASKADLSEVWQAMATLLVYLLRNYFLSEDSLTEQCLAVYRQDWPQSTLENLSTCMKTVSSRWSRSSTGKFTLFLDFLAEYCGDMDYEPVD